jgi:hypothetical protein
MLASGTTSGSGPFSDAVVNFASALPITLSEVMAPGSANALSAYHATLTCTNGNASSPTPLPTNVSTISYAFGGLKFGDAVACKFVNVAPPRQSLSKVLGGARVFAVDQFTLSKPERRQLPRHPQRASGRPLPAAPYRPRWFSLRQVTR